MKKFDLVQSITILANVGVIAGLVFVGLQLRQDHLIARQQMAFTAADQSLYWAELATSNLGLWFKGLADEPLSPEEYEGFNSLAEAWVIRLMTGFSGSRQLSTLGIEDIYVQEVALKLHENPGLKRWWLAFQVRMQPFDQAIGFADLVNRELERLEGEYR